MSSKLQIPRISDAIASTLEQRILEGSLRPGDRLPPERELAAELGVSRPSLREAIQKLASKGMVRSRQGGGTYITGALEASFFDPWQAMMGKHPQLREDLLEFRRMLEGQAAELAAQRATEADLQRLEQAFRTLDAANDSTDDAAPAPSATSSAAESPTAGDTPRADADIAFHQAVGDAAHNVLIGHLFGALLRLLHDHIRLNLDELERVPAARSRIREQHAAIYHAIRDRQPAAARAAAETHIDYVRETLHQTLRTVARRETAARRLESVLGQERG